MIPGEGGVGKSETIQTITENVVSRGVGHFVPKGAFTGIAASVIDGKTLHVLAGTPLNGSRQSSQTLKKLSATWADKRYLIIDEIYGIMRIFGLILLDNWSCESYNRKRIKL